MLHFSVPSMSCSHCVASIDSAVRAVDPTAQVTVDLDAKKVTIQNPTALPETYAAAIAEAGYDVASHSDPAH